MDKGNKTGKSVFKVLFNLILSAILFGGIASAVFLLVTGKFLKEIPKEGSITADSVSEMDTKPQEVDIDNTDSDDTAVNMTVSPVDVSELVAACEPAIVSVNKYVSETKEELVYNETLEMYPEESDTGVIIGQNETSVMIVTSFSLIKNSNDLTVTFYDENEVKAQIIGCDNTKDIAIISVLFSDMPKSTISKVKIATMGSSSAQKAGQMVVSVGQTTENGQSVSVGYISSMYYTDKTNNIRLMRFDTRNETGGAVFNSKGELIGFSMLRINDRCLAYEGLAMPIDDIKELMLQIIQSHETEEAEASYLGIVGTDIDDEYAKLLDMPVGINVKTVYKDSPAEKAGIRSGDVIVGINNTSIVTMSELADFLGYTCPGTDVLVHLQRSIDGTFTEMQIEVTLDSVKNADHKKEQ